MKANPQNMTLAAARSIRLLPTDFSAKTIGRKRSTSNWCQNCGEQPIELNHSDTADADG